MKKLSATLLLAVFGATSVVADTVYVTVMTSNCVSTATCGTAANGDLNPLGINVFLEEGGWGAYTSAKAGTADKVIVPGAFYHSNSFSNSTPDLGIVLSPGLAVTGGTYKVYHVYSSTAGNVSTNIIVGVTNVSGCTVSWTNTDKFQRSYGQPSPQSWQYLGNVTNNNDTSFPSIRFYFVDGVVSATAQQRFVLEQFKFVYYDPCTDVSGVTINGPLSTNSNQVLVGNVLGTASKVTVWQDSGPGMVQIGTLTGGIVAGDNYVTVTGLVKGAKVAASQTINGIDGCKPQPGFGVQVGGGANPRLRLTLSIKENPTATGPVGANGATGANGNIHFMPCTSVLSGSCPGDGTVTLTPGAGWQTVTVTGRQGVGNSADAAGTPANFVASGYLANDNVSLQVYAYKTFPATGIIVYSATAAQSSAVTSNDVFVVNWIWSAVAGADGYRLLRDVNSGGYSEYVDVVGVNNYSDANSGWTPGSTVTPTFGQTTPSIMWNPTANTLPNGIVGDWGILESIALASDDAGDNGPFKIYIDNLANGANGVFQDFEGFVAGTAAGAVFNQPSYSGTTSGNLLTTPNDGTIVNEAAYAGTKSQRVQWQFASGATNEWMRFNSYNTTVMPNPLVNLNEPISFRILIDPVGVTPLPPPQPTLSANVIGGQTVLSWTGAHNLQTSVNVTGPYTNAPGVTLAPYTNSFPETQRFFRLAN